MISLNHHSKKHKLGFTLVEILVVVTIIGIIAAILVPNYLEFYKKSNLESTIKLTQATLSEGFSYARSRSNHFLVVGTQGQTFIEVQSCDDLACSSTTTQEKFDFLGSNKLKSNDLKIKFLAPHGDLEFPDEASSVEEIIIKIGDDTLERSIKIYKKSGLIETDPQ